MSEEFRPFNQETDPNYNREGGVVPVPGSNLAKEMSKFEQFPSKWTHGTAGPGNPYVYRPFPKMLYRAERVDGQIKCGAAPPDPYAQWRDHRELERAQEAAERFTEKCQRIVRDEVEMSRAFEDGWRNSPQEAIDFVKGRDRAVSDATAHREFEDRNMSDAAKAEIRAAKDAVGGEHVPEVPRAPVSSPAERIQLCGAPTAAGTPCTNRAKSGGRCGKHAA